MRLVTYRIGDGPVGLGSLLADDQILDLQRAHQMREGRDTPALQSMLNFIEAGSAALDQAAELELLLPEEALIAQGVATLLAPLPVPPRLRDAGFFLEHLEIIRESMMRMAASSAEDPEAAYAEFLEGEQFKVPEVLYRRVLYYNGNHLSVIGPDAPLHWPLDCEVIDYELELGVVIGTGGHGLEPEQIASHIFGYTLFNDWSARDIQIDVMSAGLGPSMGKDFANSLGPCIVTADEIPDVSALEMTASIDGEIVSRGWTRNMHHNLATGIAELSRISPLVPGEVIGSGTPAYGSASEQGRKLSPGQTVALHIPEIGTLANTIVGPS